MELLPSRRGPKAPVSCRIAVDKIAQPSLPYKALSYAWGREAATRSMFVLPPKGNTRSLTEPKVIFITPSLHQALVELRHRARPSVSGSTRYASTRKTTTKKELR